MYEVNRMHAITLKCTDLTHTMEHCVYRAERHATWYTEFGLQDFGRRGQAPWKTL
jgi:hypothetical protein